MKEIKKLIAVLLLVFLMPSSDVFAQDSYYQAIRLNDSNPIIAPSMFTNSEDGENINGPSLIRVPDWIPTNERAHSSAKYYLYFADHQGDYIRMAWAANIEGPYTLYNDYSAPGDRGVLDNNEDDINLGNDIRIEENHLASPDVIVDHDNEQIIMYFHSGSSFFVNDSEQNDQVTWVSTSDYGLEFYDGIEPVHLGSSYFRVFEHDDDLYALDNGAKINRALDIDNPWDAPSGHDFTSPLWERNPNHVFQDDIPNPSSELRVRHTGVRVVGDDLHVFYSRRGEFQERIQLSTIDMTDNWTQWDPTYPPIEILTPNPGWEGGHREMDFSETSAGNEVNQLRDPDVFEDTDGKVYLVYTGDGESGLGIARLYETPSTDVTLTTIADAYIKESASNSNFGSLSKVRTSTGLNSSDKRTVYMKFDLSQVSNLEHAVVRLYAQSTTEGPISVYETSDNWSENAITAGNAPSLGNVITTTYLTDDEQYYDWNITEYAKANVGSVISVAFQIGPSNDANHEFGSLQGTNPGQLLISGKIPLNLTVFLQGAMNTNNILMMNDHLRQQNLLPLEEPYSALFSYSNIAQSEKQVDPSVFDQTGNDAIVDWIAIELRSGEDSTVVTKTHIGLLQRDGDVVSIDGVNPIYTDASGEYFIAVRHRNHLGVMTQFAQDFSNFSVTVDFTNPAGNFYGTHPMNLWENNTMVLWGGNINVDDKIIFQGANDDLSSVFFDILNAPDNTESYTSYVVKGYFNSDSNMDSEVIYQGANNDLSIPFFNVLSFPQNSLNLNNFIITEQLPK